MNHDLNFTVEYGVLGKKTKKITSQFQVENIEAVIGDRGMTIKRIKVPFRSFVKNFAVGFAKALGSANTTGLKNPNNASIAASTCIGVSEGAITATHSRKGIWIGDKSVNSVNAASISAVTASTIDSFLTGNVGESVEKNDIWLKRRIEASSASVATKVAYGAVGFEVLSESSFRVKRRFFNGRGTTIKIAEVGLGAGYDNTKWMDESSILFARDMFQTPITLEDQQYLDIYYTFTLSSTGYLTSNFLYMFANMLRSNSTSVFSTLHTLKDRTGVWQTSNNSYSVLGAADDTEVGIQLGEVFENRSIFTAYKLNREIANTVLDRSAVTFINEFATGSVSTKFGFQRDFTNISANTVIVEEGGLSNAPSAAGKAIYLSYFPLDAVVDPNDVLRVKIYFEMPVSERNYITLET